MKAFLLLLYATITFFDELVPSIQGNVNPDFERIITDYEEVSSGVPVDLRYTESSSNAGAGGFSSVPGCPKSVEGYPWVYYGSPTNKSCYLAGEQGPCPSRQKIFLERGTPYGFCNCDCFEGVVRQGGDPNPSQAQFCKVDGVGLEFAFLPDAKKCYVMFDQGPCKENEWLVKTNNSQATSPSKLSLTKCEPRTCPEGRIPDYATGLRSSNSCIELSPLLMESPPAAPASAAFLIGENNCSKDMKYSSLLRKCVKQFTFIS